MTDNYHGAKFDAGKLRHDLVHPEFQDALAQVLTFGAEKYEAESWRAVPDMRQRYYAACIRHVNAWRAGEQMDPESGLHHLAHAACNLYFLLQTDLEAEKWKNQSQS